jgi:hypothetical protein
VSSETVDIPATYYDNAPAARLPDIHADPCSWAFNTSCHLFTNVVPGAMIEMDIVLPGGTVQHQAFASAGDNFDFGISYPLGTTFTVSQHLCPQSDSAPVTTLPITPLPCSQMAAPRIKTPLSAGQQWIQVTEKQGGARVHVFGSSPYGEIGDSTASLISLSRPLVGGEVVKVFQETAGCLGTRYFPVAVRGGGGQ